MVANVFDSANREYEDLKSCIRILENAVTKLMVEAGTKHYVVGRQYIPGDRLEYFIDERYPGVVTFKLIPGENQKIQNLAVTLKDNLTEVPAPHILRQALIEATGHDYGELK